MECINFIIQIIVDNAHYAHWLIFGALILAGFNIPISEDLMLLTSGMLAGTVVPENTIKLFIGVFLGCYLSDWIAYWLGRYFGGRLWKVRWFANVMSKRFFCRMRIFYRKYGFWTLLVGRFIPFGVRNCLFITAGMTRMSFRRFLFSDGIACLISNSVLFTLAYFCGSNHEVLLEYVRACNLVIFTIFILFICSFFTFFSFKRDSLRV